MQDVNNLNNQINTNKPRDSRVFADGEYVIKYPVTTNPSHIMEWLNRQQHARDVVDKLLTYINGKNYYFVPKIVEISNQPNVHIREEHVKGKPITKDFFNNLSTTQQNIIYNALAIFISDMNQHLPVLGIINQFESTNSGEKDFLTLVKSIKSFISNKDFKLINDAYELLKNNPEKTPSRVFFHGDINENNIFFDTTTNTVSFIDFTEARYENADYMFNHDLSRLPWLNVNKLIEMYEKIPKQTPVIVKTDKNMMNVFTYLRTIQSTCDSLLKQPKTVEIYKRILQENIKMLESAYKRAVTTPTMSNTSVKTR